MATDINNAATPSRLGVDLNDETNRAFNLDPNGKRISRIALDLISGDPNQPRKFFDNEKIDELATSIKEHGLITPISVYVDPNDRDRYIVAVGERRFRASLKAGLEKIDAIVVENDIEEIQLIENVQREDLQPLEEATAYKKYMDKHGASQGDLARVVGKKRTTVNEILRITKLPEAILMQLENYPHVSKSQLITIAKEEDAAQQERLWFAAKSGNLSVLDTRAARKGETTGTSLSPSEKALRALAGTAKKFERLEELNADEVKEAKALVRVINRSLKEKVHAQNDTETA